MEEKNKMKKSIDKDYILIVVSNPKKNENWIKVIKEEGYKVKIIPYTELAIEYLENNPPPSLIISEIHQSGIDGFQFVQILQSGTIEKVKNVPILLTSETSLDGNFVESLSLQYGAYGFIPNPCSPERVKNLINMKLNPQKVPDVIINIYKNSGSIVILDDDVFLLKIMESVLRAEGHNVKTFSSYIEFKEFFSNYRPRIILLDYSMPEKTGLEVLEEVKSKDPSIPVIMITGYGSEKVAVEAFRKGAVDYIIKPFDPKILPNVIDRALKKQHTAFLIDQLKNKLIELDRINLQLKESLEKLNSMYRALEESKRELEELHQFKTSLLQACVHDLRAPLVSIISGSSTIKEFYHTQVPPEVIKIINNQKGSSIRLLNIINNLLDLNVIESKEYSLELRPWQLSELINDCINDMESLAITKNITIEKNLPENEPVVLIDHEKIERVLYNLLSNAIKYRPFNKKIIVNLNFENNYAIVSVKDQGPGIDSENIKHIFTKYFRISKNKEKIGNTKVHSTGLGLFISKTFVELHEGEIWAESIVGEDSTFYFKLPKKKKKKYKGTIKLS